MDITDTALEPRHGACYSIPVTVRQAILPITAVLILGIGVYLFIAVRAQPGAPRIEKATRLFRPAQGPQGSAVRDAPPKVSLAPANRPGAASGQETVVTGAPAVMVSTEEREPALSGPKLDAVMDEANQAYDRGDFEEAKTIAGRVLVSYPTNVRMLRIMVSSSCIEGDNAAAQANFAALPPSDQEQMRIRCARYGITFADKP